MRDWRLRRPIFNLAFEDSAGYYATLPIKLRYSFIR
jgi:hypothetical protein